VDVLVRGELCFKFAIDTATKIASFPGMSKPGQSRSNCIASLGVSPELWGRGIRILRGWSFMCLSWITF
jgi:hypothetical protein